MYVGTVLTLVGGGVRALSTLPGLNQQMSQVGLMLKLALLTFSPQGCPILLEPAGSGPDRDGQPSSRQPSHQGSFGKQLYVPPSLVAFTVPCLSDIWVVIPTETEKNNERVHLIG